MCSCVFRSKLVKIVAEVRQLSHEREERNRMPLVDELIETRGFKIGFLCSYKNAIKPITSIVICN